MSKLTEKLKLRSEPVTQEMFSLLPALLTRQQFTLVTGLSDRDLDAMRNANPPELKTWRRGKGYHKYYKTDAARIGNFKL